MNHVFALGKPWQSKICGARSSLGRDALRAGPLFGGGTRPADLNNNATRLPATPGPVVPVEGGTARRLTNGGGVRAFPGFSPEGKWIAFTGRTDGSLDI